MDRSRRWLCGSAVLLLACANALSQVAQPRTAVPNDAAIERSIKLVNEVYATEITAARTAAQRSALARKLIESADATRDDPSGRYALLVLARDNAAQAGDAATAVGAVEQITSSFEVDGLKLSADALAAVARSARGAEDFKALVNECLRAGAEAVAVDRYDVAEQVSTLGLATARRLQDRQIVERITIWRTDLASVVAAHEKVKPALALLAGSPDDAAANLAVGRFLCYTKSDWARGLVHLARSSEPATATLAKNELASSDTAMLTAVADGWWDLGQTETALAKRNILAHAAGMYRQLAPELNGLAKDKAQRRAAQAGAETAFPGRYVAPATRPAVTPSQPPSPARGAADTRPPAIRVSNTTRATEAQKIIASVQASYPRELQGSFQAQLVSFHEGFSLAKNGGVPATIASSFSKEVLVGTGDALSVSTPTERLRAGRYSIVFRIYAAQQFDENDVCLLEVCSGGGTIASRRVSSADLKSRQWIDVPLVLTLTNDTSVEYRFGFNKHVLALDRIYVFRLI